MMRRTSALLVYTVLTLTACDNTPNSTFEQSMKDREAANAGDPYASLENSMPKQLNLTYRRQGEHQDHAAGQSGTFRATYDALLSRLDEDQNVDRSSALFQSCRRAFAGASAFQKDSSNAAADASPGRARVLAALVECRNAAKKAGKQGATLARFASTGMVMVGAKVAGQGDLETGLKIWREGEQLVAQDKPGFEVGLKTLRGY